ncbi:MAG: glycosyltransferase family 39 protein [Marinosulfonomonas sp.]
MADRLTHTQTNRFWLLLFACYYAFHICYRIILGGALGLDESQTILDAQHFAWGYGPQPPLYAWLQRIVFLMFGDTLFSMTLFKNTLLFGTVSGVFLVIRQFANARVAGISAAGLMLLQQISWESQRDLSHSVITAFFAVWTVVVLARLLRKPDWLSFALFGAVMGFGCLSKYNYMVFAAALILAMVSLPEARKLVFQKKLLLSLLLVGVIVSPHLYWVSEHVSFALSSSGKFQIAKQNGAVTALLGIGSELVAVANFSALLILVVGLIYWRYRTSPKPELPEMPLLLRVVWRAMVIGLALIAIGVFASGATNVKDRWLIPNLIWIAPLTVFWVSQRISNIGTRRLLQTYGVLAVLVIIGLPIHIYGHGSRRAAPFADMAQIFNAQTVATDPVIAPNWTAGNLFWSAQRPVYRHEDLKGQVFDTPMLFVWRGEDMTAPANFVKRRFKGWTYDEAKITTLRLPFAFNKDSDFLLSYVRLLPPEG